MALTTQTPGTISPPSDLTEAAPGAPAVPNNLAEQTPGTPAIPNNLTEAAPGSVAIPNNLTEQSAGSVAIPNNLTEQSAGSVAIPNNLTEQAVGAIPRTLDPILKLDFENEVYETTSNQGLDDIVTYTRNSSASFWNRRQDEQGRWETFLDTDYVGSVTNLFTYSEDYTQADWDKLSCTATASNTIDYFGNTAYKIETTGANAFPYLRQTPTVSAGLVTFSAIVKKGNTSEVYLRINGTGIGGGADTSTTFSFNFDNQTFTNYSGYASTEYFSNYLGDGWYEFGLSVEVTTVTSCDIRSAYNTTDILHCYVARAQITESAKLLPYVVTTTTSASETFVESPRLEYDPITAEPLGYLAEGASTNLFSRSEEFDNADWTKGLSQITANAVIAPDGTRSADAFEASTTGTNTPQMTQAETISSGTEYTFSIYAKAFQIDVIQLRFGGAQVAGDPEANFDLANGVLGRNDADANAEIQDCGNGWYRCSISVTSATTVLTGYVQAMADPNDARSATNSWTAGQGCYLWGAMLEELPFASSYIRTEGATVQRTFDLMYGSIENLQPKTTMRIEGKFLDISYLANNQTIFGVSTNLDERYMIYNRSGEWGAYIEANNVAQTGSLASNGANDNEYHTATLTAEFNNVSFYADKQLESVDTSAIMPIVDTFSIGGVWSGSTTSSRAFAHIKSVQTYNELLSASEVALGDSLSGITEAVIPALSAPNNLTEQAVGAVSAPNQLVNEPTTNLLLRSEEFNTSWNVSNATIGVDSGIAPNGQTTADKIISDVGGGIRPRVDQSPSGSSDTYIVSVYGKPSGWDFLTINRGGTNSVGGVFDVANGTIVNTGASLDNIGIQFAGNGWYRCWIVFTDTPTNLQIGTSATGVLPLTSSTGDGASGILIWGAQCEVSQALQVPTSYLKTESTSLTEGQVSIPNNLTEQTVSAFPRTFAPLLNLDFANEIYATNDEPSALDDIVTYTRNSSASFWNRRIGRNGKYETFLDTDYVGSVTNLWTYSEDISNADWTKNRVDVSLSNEITPDGIKAYRIEEDTTPSQTHLIIQNVTTIANTGFNISFFAKPDEITQVTVRGDMNGTTDRTTFNLVGEGAIQNQDAEHDNASIHYAGNGFYKISVTVVEGGTGAGRLFGVELRNGSYTGDGVSGLFVSQLQVTQSVKALPYVKTLASSASETFVETPRLEYDPITAQPLGYLAEGASTNLQIWSEEFDNVAYTKTGGAITANDTVAPDGTKSADLFTIDSSTGSHSLADAITFTDTESYTFSIFVKWNPSNTINQLRLLAGNAGILPLDIRVNFSTLTVIETSGTGKIIDCGNGWYRIEASDTAVSSGLTNLNLNMFDGASNSFTGNGTDSFHLWGWQVENLPFSSSYIRTESGTVQRVNETLQLSSGIVNEARQSITLSAEARQSFFPNDTQRFIMSINMDGTAQSFLSTTTGNEFRHRNGETASSTNFTLTANNVDQFYKSALSFNGSESRLFVNGDFDISNADSGGDVTVSNVAINIGTNDGGASGSHWYGNIKSVKIYDEGLTDQEVSLL